ncbi:MAG: diadenylate cyclase, partial [Planctomycetota bacterium]
GVRIDAKLTAALLLSIFERGTPLHDMAVVVRGDRVVAARVQLPLAEADTADGVELGSRHRAAIGITAGSDATCLVVSEETGVVSIGEGGRLTRNIDESRLRKHLLGMMDEMASPAFSGVVGRLRRLPKKETAEKGENA